MKLALILFKYGVSLDDPCCYPLGFMYISAVLKRAGHDVMVYNLNLSDDYPDDFTAFDAVLMTGFEEFLPQIKATAYECRKVGVKTILGGALATFKSDEMLKYVDTVIVGEGEAVIGDALLATGKIQGSIPDLASLPYPDYEGFGINDYHSRHPLRYMGVLTSRGCPYSCRFCAHTCSFQYRDIGAVFEEIDYYRKTYNVSAIVFNDNTLNVSKSRFLQICGGMKQRGLKWSAAIRVDRFDEEMAQAAKESGCLYFVVGVESFDQQKLDAMNKRIKVKQIKATLGLLHKYGINYHGNVLLGLPGETMPMIEEEISSIPDGYNVFPVMVQPFVGTEYTSRSIDNAEYQLLMARFRAKINDKGMEHYPEVKVAV